MLVISGYLDTCVLLKPLKRYNSRELFCICHHCHLLWDHFHLHTHRLSTMYLVVQSSIYTVFYNKGKKVQLRKVIIFQPNTHLKYIDFWTLGMIMWKHRYIFVIFFIFRTSCQRLIAIAKARPEFEYSIYLALLVL